MSPYLLILAIVCAFVVIGVAVMCYTHAPLDTEIWSSPKQEEEEKGA